MLLLFGGQSAEHDVSRVSAVAVARALDPARYEVVPVGITREGRWLLAEAARAALDSGERLAAFMVEGPPVRMGESADLVRVDPRAPSLGPIDVVFPLLHGPYGEDGTVQGLLELAGLPYVGAGVLGSAVGMDKVMMKRAFLACGLPTPAHVPLREDFDKADLDRVQETLGYPCFVKPANLGSSVGVSRAHRPPGAGGGGGRRPALRRMGAGGGGHHRARDRSGGAGGPTAGGVAAGRDHPRGRLLHL